MTMATEGLSKLLEECGELVSESLHLDETRIAARAARKLFRSWHRNSVDLPLQKQKAS